MALLDDETTSAQDRARQERIRAITTIDKLALIGVVLCTFALVLSFLPYDPQRLESEDLITMAKLLARVTLPWLLIIGAALLVIGSRLIRSKKSVPIAELKRPSTCWRGSREIQGKGDGRA